MVAFCNEIESNPELSARYHRHVDNIAEWYRNIYKKYAEKLEQEFKLGIKAICEDLKTQDIRVEEIPEMVQSFLNDLEGANNTKMPDFVMADALVKLILSKYSLGPGENDRFLTEHGIQANLYFKDGNRTWINCTAYADVMTELLAKVLRDEEPDCRIELQALNQNRAIRAKIVHAGQNELSLSLSVMRDYNIIRDLIHFLDPDIDLPVFTFCELFNYDKLRSEPCRFLFDDTTTILIADSVHDVRSDYLAAVANLPWNLVIDLDGYSDCGGLLSTVNHNRIQKEILTRKTADQLSELPSDGRTLWYRCGEYQSTNFIPNDKFSIGAYTAFHKDLKANKQNSKNLNWKAIFRELIQRAKDRGCFINIAALTNNFTIVNQLIQAIVGNESDEFDDYFITWVGLDKADIQGAYGLDDEGESSAEYIRQHFMHQPCPMYQFYQAFAEHSGSWRMQTSLNSEFTLPTANGSVVLSENDRNNIADDFCALYDHCEEADIEQSENLRKLFYSGNIASWNTIASDDIPRLRKDNEFEQMQQEIRTLLGQTQKDPDKRLYFIRHTAGMGGSTLARQLVWALHTSYAVLEVRNYVHSSFTKRIQHLYDHVLDKSPIILFADDTLPSFVSLCDEVRGLERRCILVSACRDESGVFQKYPKATCKYVSSLSDEAINKLQKRYRQISTLSSKDLDIKDKEFRTVLHGSMFTPFIIGLYYKEREFCIDRYVTKTFDGCGENRYKDVLAYLALCDCYQSKNLPVFLIKDILGFKGREDFLRSCPAAGSLITVEDQNTGKAYYHFVDRLLSKCYLEIYCERLYGSKDNLPNVILQLSEKLIDHIAKASEKSFDTTSCLDTLIGIMIQNKKVDDGQHPYSALMEDIGLPQNQRKLMKHLAETFQPLADDIMTQRKNEPEYEQHIDRKKQMIQRLVSHTYAHLGRMYSRDDRNYKKADEAFQKAIDYMPDEDPNIFHMAGSALLDQLKEVFSSSQEITPEQLDDIRRDVQRAAEYFDYTTDYGSPDYGYPSKLELLYCYLRFLFQYDGVQSKDDLSKLKPKTCEVQAEFMNVLEEAKNYPDLEQDAHDKIQDYESRFRSNIIFGDFGRAVQYYQNELERINPETDTAGYKKALRNLIFAQITQARHKAGEAPFCCCLKNARKTLENIQELLSLPFDASKFSDYMTRTQMFHYWMMLAKHLEVSVDTGLDYANRWIEMEEKERYNNRNPEPYYYKSTLLYLEIREGSSKAREELHELTKQISSDAEDKKFDRRRGDIEKIRDILIEGREMGQLLDITHLDVTHRATEEERLKAVRDQNCEPITVSAHLEGCPGKNIADMEIYEPSCWKGEPARLNIGRHANHSITSAQIHHRIQFVMGFSTLRLTAVSCTAADIDASEVFAPFKALPKGQISIKADKPSVPQSKTIPIESRKPAAFSAPSFTRGERAILKDIRLFTDNNNKRWLNGKVDGLKAGVSVEKDLMQFPESEFRRYGGIDEVIARLQEKAEAPCVIIDRQENISGVRYRVSFYEACDTIEGLLEDRVKNASAEAAISEQPSVQQAAVPNGTVVQATIQKIDGKSADGEFIYQEKTYPINLKIKKKKEHKTLDTAYRRREKIAIRITGFSNECYSGQCI